MPHRSMTFTRTHITTHVLHAFAGHRWHTTAEIATHAHYGPMQTRRALTQLHTQGRLERTGHTTGTYLWRIPETRHCTYCNNTQPTSHFYRTTTGGFWSVCRTERHDKYILSLHPIKKQAT